LEKYFKTPLQKNRFQNSAQKYVHGIPTNLTLFSYETQTPIYNWQLEEKYFAQTIELLKNKEIKTLDDFFAILQCIKTPSKIIELNSQYQSENQKTETKTESEIENEESIINETSQEELSQNENQEVQTPEDLEKLLQTLKQQDSERKKIYALSLYKDSEKNPEYELNIFAKEFVASYFGQESFYLGFYDSKTGKFQSPVEKNSVYIQALKFLNLLPVEQNQTGLFTNYLNGDIQVGDPVYSNNGIDFNEIKFGQGQTVGGQTLPIGFMYRANTRDAQRGKYDSNLQSFYNAAVVKSQTSSKQNMQKQC
jgi:hypothetical protein